MTAQLAQPEHEENETIAGLKAKAESMEQPTVTKEETEQAKNEAEAESAAAVASAHGAMAVVTMVLKSLFPYLEIDPKESANVAESVAPVLEKYGFHLGGNYQVELTAAASVGMFGVMIYGQMSEHERAKAEEQSKNKQAINHGKE